jgi:uncharacterized damage-inducible protein DinB
MATASDLLLDAFGRIQESIHDVLEGLSDEQLATPVAPRANTIAWLVWHISRLMDDHIADVADSDQLWTSQGWADRFGLPFPVKTVGYGQSVEQAHSVRVSGGLLGEYFDAAHDQAVEFVRSVTEVDLDRVVDVRWDPPVTLAVRLISVVNDSMQHVGQAAYAKGILIAAG